MTEVIVEHQDLTSPRSAKNSVYGQHSALAYISGSRVPTVYHESLSLPWVQVYTTSASLYLVSMYIPWVQVYTMSISLYHEAGVKGQRLAKGTLWTKVPLKGPRNLKMYLKVQGTQKLHKGPRNPKSSKSSTRYLKVQCIANVPKGARYTRGN